MVRTKLWLSLLCGAVGAMLTAAVLAANYLDDSNVNDGKWNARIDGDAKTARQGRVVIDNFGERVGVERKTCAVPSGLLPSALTITQSTEGPKRASPSSARAVTKAIESAS